VIARTASLLVRMLRFRVAVTMWTFMLLGLAAHAGPTLSLDLVLATIALAASYVTATTLNDIADEPIDRVNRPRDRGRPLVWGDATTTDLRRCYGTATGLAVAAAVPLGPVGAAAIGTSLLLSWAYSAGPIRFSRRMVLAPLALSAAYVVVPYWLGLVLADDGWRSSDVPIVVGLFVLFTARIVLKDFRDRLGDERYGKPTLLFRLGKRATCATSMTGAAIGSSILIVEIAPTPLVASILIVPVVAIEWMLWRLRAAADPRSEQIAIGLAARAGNCLLLSLLAILLLRAEGAAHDETALVVGLIVATFTAAFIGPARHPETVRIGYKA
jgi:chlorophyll/bacteriochlorophyll a synthase